MNHLTIIAISLLAIAMSGCANSPEFQPTQIIYKPVETKIPIQVPCLSQAQIPQDPQYELDNPLLAQQSIAVQGQAALREIEQRRQWQREAKALLHSCAKNTP